MLFKKKKLNSGITPTNCIICEIRVITNVDQTCGDPACKLKAHELFHSLIQETQGTIEGRCFV
jgi:hypothetical protein